MSAPQALKDLRHRFLTDFAFWARHCCTIRTKEGTIVKLVLNRVQRRFLKAIIDQLSVTGRVRMVVLKARQQGLSTVIHAFLYWWLSQHSAQKCLVMAHEAESTTTLFDMYRRTHDNMPEMLRPSTKYSSRSELTFDKLDTGLRVATAGGRGVARGETLQAAHLSEVGFWPPKFAEANFNGLIQAVPELDNTFMFVESTAQGMVGKFRELWVGAVNGESNYYPFFSPWFESYEYRTPAPDDFTRTPAEEKFAESVLIEYNGEFIIDDDQLFWRRQKIGSNGTELFKQEYPANSDEAFLNTGRPIFHPEYLNDRIKLNIQPIKLMAVEEGSVREHPAGELKVYHDVEPSGSYCIGCDVGMGVRNGDLSVAQVLDADKRQVAVWRGLVHPDYFAKIIVALGYYYNTALVAPERNNHGILTCVHLRDLQYPNIYTDVTEGALDDKDTINIGFLTTEKTKPLIIDELRAADRERAITINDQTTLREMLSYVVTESGRMEAEVGAHDDCVMSLAIANHVHEGRWEPIKIPDDCYARAI